MDIRYYPTPEGDRICGTCGALVRDHAKHTDWHRTLNGLLADLLVASKPAERAA